jgi:hypothetical protein
LGCILVEDSIETEGLILDSLSVWYDAAGELLYRIVFRRIENPESVLEDHFVPGCAIFISYTHKHLSSTTLMTGLIPLCASLGALGTPARDPSPRNKGVSSHLESWAASRMVKGRTLTVTEIDDEALFAAIPNGAWLTLSAWWL